MGKVIRGSARRRPAVGTTHHAFFSADVYYYGNAQWQPSPSPVFTILRPSPVRGKSWRNAALHQRCGYWMLSRERALRRGEPQTSRAWKSMGREDEAGPSSCRFTRPGARTVSASSPCFLCSWPLDFPRAWREMWSTNEDGIEARPPHLDEPH